VHQSIQVLFVIFGSDLDPVRSLLQYPDPVHFKLQDFLVGSKVIVSQTWLLPCTAREEEEEKKVGKCLKS